MFAVIHLGNFSLQAVLRHEPELAERPVALIDPRDPKPVVTQANRAAQDAGVVAGFTPNQAQARCAGIILKSRSAAQDADATDILLQTAAAFSPNLEATAPGVCTIELKGLRLETESAARLWAEKIRETLERFNFASEIGVAPTPALALLAARTTDSVAVHFTTAEFVAALPLEALEPPPEIRAIVSAWGIRTAGEFLALGREQLSARLGAPALELFDRVSPRAVRPLKLVVPAEHFSERMEFEHEIETTEPLLFVMRRFTEQLAQRVEMARLVVGELQLQLNLSGGGVYQQLLKIPQPTNRIETLFRMLQTRLETLRTDSPVIELHLTASPARPDAHQLGFFEASLRNPNQFGETLARLAGLCGSDRVGTPVLETTHRPDAFKMTAPDFSLAQLNSGANHESPGLQLRRFRQPMPVAIELNGERPQFISSSGFRGAVRACRGPFHSSGDWWDRHEWSRQEWDVETTDGALLRVFRTSDGCFLEGVYD